MKMKIEIDGLYENNNLKHLAAILFQQYSILQDDSFQHEGSYYRSTQFKAGGNYYLVDKVNGDIIAISKSKIEMDGEG